MQIVSESSNRSWSLIFDFCAQQSSPGGLTCTTTAAKKATKIIVGTSSRLRHFLVAILLSCRAVNRGSVQVRFSRSPSAVGVCQPPLHCDLLIFLYNSISTKRMTRFASQFFVQPASIQSGDIAMVSMVFLAVTVTAAAVGEHVNASLLPYSLCPPLDGICANASHGFRYFCQLDSNLYGT